MDDDSRTAREEESIMGKPNKRLRVSQACEPCRLKKGKCDGRQPTCTVCQYSSLERRAMLAEMIAAFLMSKTKDGEESIRSFFNFHDPELPFLVPGEKQTELYELLDRWKKGPVSQWLLETADRTDPTLDQMSRLRSNQGSGTRPSITVRSNDQHILGRGNDTSPRPVSVDVEADVDMNQRASSETTHRLNPLPSDIEDIFEIYFAYTHTWLPFIDKFKLNAFARTSSNCPHDASELTSLQSANLALTWAIVAYASTRQNMSEDVNGDSESKPLPAEAARQSLSLIPAFDADMQHEHIQALIILAMYFFESRDQRTSWLLIGLAGRVAMDLSTVAPGQHLSSISRRTSLACFVVEGIIAAALDRKPQLPTLHSQAAGWSKEFSVENIYEVEAEGWEEWSSWDMPGRDPSLLSSSVQARKEPFRVLSTFNQMVMLVEILNKTPYSFDSSKRGDILSITSDSFADGPPELSTWAYRIGDSHPSLAPTNVEDALFPHAINIHAIYLLIRSRFHLESRVLEQDKQRYRATSHSLASAVNALALKYRSAYPTSPLPLGLTASIVAAAHLPTTEDTLKRSLSKILCTARSNGEIATDRSELHPFRGRTRGKSPFLFSASDLFGGRRRERYNNVRLDPAAQLPPQHGVPVASDSEYTSLAQGVQAASSGLVDLSGGLDMDVMGMDVGETSSLSAHDLTVLDAAVWYVFPVASPKFPVADARDFV
ncbi:hypothetical protein NM208_g10016 [Fusarium decemcellulare]|uniref:Uncharacterized protein n=1 Tax=Fusarium decemcellulare TaxID=57161 RepID=A0ACC1RZF4_9HYPO|nr:hypothetical protein NM208_g10016 [Fusarium decemcellulare]